MSPRSRRKRIYAAHLERLNASLDQRLAERRKGREVRNASARAGVAAKIHQAYARDALVHGPVLF